MPIDQAKLAKLQQQTAKKVGGSRVKATKKVKESDDVKLMETLGKFKATKIPNVTEANFFKDDGKVIHFKRVGVQGANEYNTFAFTGYAQETEVTKLIPDILPQLGAENLQILSQLAQQIQQGKAPQLNKDGNLAANDEEIPDLTEGQNFDDVE